MGWNGLKYFIKMKTFPHNCELEQHKKQKENRLLWEYNYMNHIVIIGYTVHSIQMY